MSEFTGKTAKEHEAFIAELIKNCDTKDYMKINLDRGNGSQGNGEGVWAVSASEKDRDIYRDNKSNGEHFKVYLCNMPIGKWNGRCWGCPVIATTFGEKRPVAFAKDQEPLNKEVEYIVGIIGMDKDE